jgi:hypothetical protein
MNSVKQSRPLCSVIKREPQRCFIEVHNYLIYTVAPSTPDKIGSRQPSSLHAHTGCILQNAIETLSR